MTQSQIKAELKIAWASYEAARAEVIAHNDRCRSYTDLELTHSDTITWSDTSYARAMWARIAHLTSSLPMSKGARRAADILAAGGSYHKRSHWTGAARVFPANDPQHKGYTLRESTVTDLSLRGIL